MAVPGENHLRTEGAEARVSGHQGRSSAFKVQRASS